MRLGPQPDAREHARAMARELHTLKGDAHLIGFRDAAQLCHKLEELLAAAERHHFQVGEELDLAVTMAIGFCGMVIRRKVDGAADGIDLPSFVRHIDALLAGANAIAAEPPAPAAPPVAREEHDALSARSRGRLAIVATDVYLGALASEGATRAHLHGAWTALVDHVNRLRTTPLDRRLLRHAHAARRLAAELGREVDVVFEVRADAVDAHALDALDEALVHAVRNAIDHGIAPPAERVARGKPARGVVRIASTITPDRVQVAVSDDGDGVDLEAVRRRAIERGLVPAREAPLLPPDALVELVFTPGFSTRDRPGEVSGRGVGLDAVRDAIRAEGGDVTITNDPGGGTSLIAHVPHQEPGLAVHCFASSIAGVLLAVPADWRPLEVASPPPALPELDLSRTGLHVGPARVLVTREPYIAILPARWPPVRAYAERICPTPADHALEIVRVDGADAILVRPQALASRRARRASRVALDDSNVP